MIVVINGDQEADTIRQHNAQGVKVERYWL
jgi:hypothetical protein